MGASNLQYPGVSLTARISIRLRGNVVMVVIAARGWNVKELAEKAGLHPDHVERRLRGETHTTPETAKRIQRALAPAQWHDLFALASTGTEGTG